MVLRESRTLRAEAKDWRATDEEGDGSWWLVEFARFAGVRLGRRPMGRPFRAQDLLRVRIPKAMPWAGMGRTVGAGGIRALATALGSRRAVLFRPGAEAFVGEAAS
jgi:hypothetical protein